MSRYVHENILRSDALNSNKWWENFDSEITRFTFLFIISYLKGEYVKQLEYISASNSGIKGAAVGIENLLYISENIKSGKYSRDDFYKSFNNKELALL